jgi:voltage-gated potassium channel
MNDTPKKIILFGLSNAAVEIGFNLREKGFDFFIVDDDPQSVKVAEEHRFDLRLMDYEDDDVLQKAGIGAGVELIYCLFPDDARNIFLAISARSLDEKLNIVAVTQTHDSIHKLKAAGADTVLDPYQIAGKKIYEVIRKPEIVRIIDDTVFGREKISIEEITVGKGSRMDGILLEKLDTEGYNLIILGLHDKEARERFIFVTEGRQRKLDASDVLVVVGEDDEIERFRKEFAL